MSNYYDVLSGVKASIQGVPLVIVAPGPSYEKIKLQTFGNAVVYDYPVLIAYVVPGNRLLNADLQSFLDKREAIRDQLYQIGVPGLTRAWDTEMKIGSVSKFAALVGTTYRVTGWEFTYSVSEVRRGE